MNGKKVVAAAAFAVSTPQGDEDKLHQKREGMKESRERERGEERE